MGFARRAPSPRFASWGSGRPACTAGPRLALRLESLEAARDRLADELGILLRFATAGLLAPVAPPPRPQPARAPSVPAPTAWHHVPAVPRFRWSEL